MGHYHVVLGASLADAHDRFLTQRQSHTFRRRLPPQETRGGGHNPEDITHRALRELAGARESGITTQVTPSLVKESRPPRVDRDARRRATPFRSRIQG